ncbi:MAG: FAD-binding protein, partial [Thauera sp.]
MTDAGCSPRVDADSQVVADADLSALNTFGLRARAARLLRVRSVETLRAAIAAPGWTETPRLVLGGGSNLVFGGDFPGTVLRVEIPGRRLLRSDAEAWIVEAGAGESWHDFVRWTLAQGWPGLENLSLIPGTVGAAPIQNIGAYGLELVERFEPLDAVELD